MKTLAKYPGVYLIVNVLNNRKYVGSTPRPIVRRFYEHRCELRHNRHGNMELQDEWNEYGEKSFVFTPLENISNEVDIIKRECYWYEHYLSIGHKLYNQVHPSDNGHTNLHKERTIEKMKASQQKRYENMTAKEKKELVKPLVDYRNSADFENFGETVSNGWYEKNENSKPVILVSPNGNIHEVKHRHSFALNHGLDPSALTKIIKGVRKSHKGWTCQHNHIPK